MPIVFECSGCGKPLQVPDAAAGKKTRCPACGAIATAPPPPPQFEVVEEPPPPPRPVRPVARPIPPTEVNYADAPLPPRQPKPAPEEDATPMTLAEPDRPRKKKRRRRLKPSRTVHHDSSDTWYTTKRIMFIGLGGFIMLGGIVAMVADDHPMRFFRGICALIVGGGLFIQGLTGDFND